MARLTLSDDARGRFGFVGFAGGLPSSEQVFIETTITDGIIAWPIAVPEPPTIALIAVGSLGLATRRFGRRGGSMIHG